MGKLSHLEPKSVFGYFEEICGMPHGSGNVEQISNYLVAFAKKQELFYVQDSMKNVIICKEASTGYEEKEPLILQAHMDMVAVKKLNAEINLETDGLDLQVEGDLIYAKDTSLGGDNGVGVAYALAALASNTLQHPRLECVFTVDEEIGMDGATAIDLSMLQGKQLLNIDSEEEGILLTSCAGGAHLYGRLEVPTKEMTGMQIKLVVTGCKGGHSGVEIHKGRANANHLLFRALLRLYKKCSYGLVEASGGSKDNAIPREAEAILVVNQDLIPLLQEEVTILVEEYNQEYRVKEEGITLDVIELGIATSQAVVEDSMKQVYTAVLGQPDGVQTMSSVAENMVETSLNLGILEYKGGILRLQYAVRSSVESAKYGLLDRMTLLLEQLGGSSEIKSIYPAWEYLEESQLRNRMTRIYEKMYGEEMELQGVHAGLECGILSKKIPDLDCVSFGPNLYNIHTTEETASISSIARVWDYIVAVIEA
ncbi:MAG: aminoacyl-histidine dipeptidase [Eubacteriales bacterium]